jgi:putative transposase
MNDDPLFESLRVTAPDRHYQIWERNSLHIDIYSEKVLLQKLNYLHNNPIQVKWQLSTLPESYQYSSARFYETGFDEFSVLTHYRE